MLHVVSLHLDFMRTHQQLQVVLLQETLRHVLAKHNTRLSSRRLTTHAIHRVRPQNVLQQTVHAVRETVDLLDVLDRHSVLLEQTAVENQHASVQNGADGQRAETLREQLHDGGVVLRLHLALEAEHLVDLPVMEGDNAHGRFVVAAQHEETVRLHQLVAEHRQRHLHGEVAAVREVAYSSGTKGKETVEEIRCRFRWVAELVEYVNEVVVLSVHIAANGEHLLRARGRMNLDHVGQRSQIADRLYQNHVNELRVNLLSRLVPLQHVHDEALRNCVIVNVIPVIHIIDRGALHFR